MNKISLLLLWGLLSLNIFAKGTVEEVQINLNWTWTLIAAAMVFFMQAGFAMVESGFTSSKYAGNIVMKNVMDFCMGILAFWAFGFAFMFGKGELIGSTNFFLEGLSNWDWTFFIFQGVFAATAATIVSGALAGRTKFSSYLIVSFLLTAIIYPIFGHWSWASLFGQSEGWLEKLGFIDFAGSTVVHSIGGWAALAGAIMVGPRIGKYRDKKPLAIPGHSLPLAALGVFILWFGWFGFNAGSQTEGVWQIGIITVNTLLSGASGAISALLVSYLVYKKADIGMTLNGILAGLVGITAGCANVDPWASVVIGVVSGVVVFFSVNILDKIGIDDPVGAVSVHGVCGAWGTLAAGIFNSADLFNPGIIGVQAIGVGAAFVFAFGSSCGIFYLVKKTFGLRVDKVDEIQGLDVAEHGLSAYPEFKMEELA